VASACQHGADLVITDIVMPDMEGIETIIALRSLSADCKIIATTGGSRTGIAEHLRSATLAGANDVLS
jgi:CheY-like chemotaxis protein